MLVTKVRGGLSWRKCRKEKSKKRKKAATQEGCQMVTNWGFGKIVTQVKWVGVFIFFAWQFSTCVVYISFR